MLQILFFLIQKVQILQFFLNFFSTILTAVMSLINLSEAHRSVKAVFIY